jgi:hypothetical protein
VGEQDLLIVAAELGVAIAGFTGVISVFGSRSRESWSVIERFRIESLLSASLAAVALALLGLALVAADADGSLVWNVSSIAWLAWALVTQIRLFPRFRKARSEGGTISTPYNIAVWAAAATVAALQIWNIAALHEFWPFFVGLSLNLVPALSFFRRLFLLG